MLQTQNSDIVLTLQEVWKQKLVSWCDAWSRALPYLSRVPWIALWFMKNEIPPREECLKTFLLFSEDQVIPPQACSFLKNQPLQALPMTLNLRYLMKPRAKQTSLTIWILSQCGVLAWKWDCSPELESLFFLNFSA